MKFQIGQRLEAVDRLNSPLVCVAHVRDIRGEELLISFDGWEDKYDYWCTPDSPEIAFIGTTEKLGKVLQPPRGYTKEFTWSGYLKEINETAAPVDAFEAGGLGEFDWGKKISDLLHLQPRAPEEAVEKKDIFLSYGREPHVTPWVRNLKEDLETAGYTVWMDEDGIGSGTNWFLKIGSAVLESKALIAVVTEKYLHSEWCVSELFMAKQEKKLIIPCFYENVQDYKPDVKYALGDHKNFVQFQGFHSGEAYEEGFQNLIDTMKKIGVPVKPKSIQKGTSKNFAYNLKKIMDPQTEVAQRLEALLIRLERLDQRNSLCTSCSIS